MPTFERFKQHWIFWRILQWSFAALWSFPTSQAALLGPLQALRRERRRVTPGVAASACSKLADTPLVMASHLAKCNLYAGHSGKWSSLGAAISATLCNSMDCSREVCTNSCPLSWLCHPTVSSSVTPFPSSLHLFQHQGIFQWADSLQQVAKVLELQLHSFQWIFRVNFLFYFILFYF